MGNKKQVMGMGQNPHYQSWAQSKAQKLKPHSNAQPVGGPGNVDGTRMQTKQPVNHDSDRGNKM